MKKVYVVTSGQYSDYSINGIFDSKDKAEKFMEVIKSDDYNEIEERELNPYTYEITNGLSAFRVSMQRNGDSSFEECSEYSLEFCKNRHTYFRWDDEIMYHYCFAKDGQHAVKITNEKRALLIATNQWGRYLTEKQP